MSKKVKFIEVNSELAAGTRGASLGVGAVKTASLNKKNDFFKHYESVEVRVYNEKLWDDEQNFPKAKRIDGVHQVLQNVSDAVSKEIELHYPVVLAGDHSTAAGTICGIKKANPNKRLGVIWIDAHADLHTPYTTPSGNMHGMPLAIAMAEDNLESQVNEVKGETLELWEKCKNVGIEGPKLNPEDLVFIVVRDTEKPEDDFIARHDIKNFTYDEVKEKGVLEVAKESLERLSECDMIYITFDVDSIDSKFSKGTGTPVPNESNPYAYGLTPDEAKELNVALVKNDKVVCWEMVEVNPTLDTVNKMAENTFDVLEAVVKEIEKK